MNFLPKNGVLYLLITRVEKMEYKIGCVVKHPNQNLDWGVGVVLNDDDGTSVQVCFSTVGVKTLSLQHVKPIIIENPSEHVAKAKEIIAKNRVYIGDSFLDIFHDIKSKYPHHLIIIENGRFFDALEQDAEVLSEKYGWKIYERQTGVAIGFPVDARKIWEDLRNQKIPYIVVSQLPKNERLGLQRSISEVFL